MIDHHSFVLYVQKYVSLNDALEAIFTFDQNQEVHRHRACDGCFSGFILKDSFTEVFRDSGN